MPMPSEVPHPESDHNSSGSLLFVRKDELTLDKFQCMWSSHTPIVVQGVHLDFQVKWTPDYFKERYGERLCEVEDCETGQCLPGFTVSDYFGTFGQRRVTGAPILRLKVSIITSPSLNEHDTALRSRTGLQRRTSAKYSPISWTTS